MTSTVVDQNGRVLSPKDLREEAGLNEGTMVRVEKQGDGVMIKPIRGGRTWKKLCGTFPKRTGKPQWPTVEDIKNIWQ